MARLKKSEKEYIKRVLFREAHRDAAHMTTARDNEKKQPTTAGANIGGIYGIYTALT